jgi:hypothetical protein
MKWRPGRYALAFLLSTAGLPSCDKEESDPSPSLLPEEHLMMLKWQLQRVTRQSPPEPLETDVTHLTLLDCEKDDLISFDQNRQITLYEGVASCGSTGKSVFRSVDGGKWTYSASDSVLTLEKGFNKQLFRLRQADASTLIVFQKGLDYFLEEIWYIFYLREK